MLTVVVVTKEANSTASLFTLKDLTSFVVEELLLKGLGATETKAKGKE